MQLVMLAMLLTSFAQIAYWIVDEAHYMGDELEAKLDGFKLSAITIQTLIDDGHAAQLLTADYPHLLIEAGLVRVDPESVDELISLRHRRLIRYGSEGTFLLLVFIAGIATLASSLRQSTELLRRQENFVAAVSHEFKTPLASIKLSAETLLLREVSLENQRKLADRVVQDTERLEAMVTNILKTGMVDEGQLHLRAEDLLLQEIIAPLAHKRGCQAHMHSVDVQAEIDESLAVSCDRNAFFSVIDNLLSNAIKSVTAKGGGQVKVFAVAEGKEVRIDVVDNGLGFDTVENKKLFEKFYRPGEELRRRTEGTGLGLFVVKSLVEGSGGRIQARSDGDGQGATFSLWLPRGVGASA
ncbi:MAG: signal transduction histidine kinase [Planctomycetota bacterium]|jgi:signal transduction histidine kinase